MKKQKKQQPAMWKEIQGEIIRSNPFHHPERGVYAELIYEGSHIGNMNYTKGTIEFVENEHYDIKIAPASEGLERREGITLFYAKKKEPK